MVATPPFLVIEYGTKHVVTTEMPDWKDPVYRCIGRTARNEQCRRERLPGGQIWGYGDGDYPIWDRAKFDLFQIGLCRQHAEGQR